MKASELIKFIQQKCNGEDLDIEFLSYEWDEDLETKSYHQRTFECIKKRKNKIQIYVEGDD